MLEERLHAEPQSRRGAEASGDKLGTGDRQRTHKCHPGFAAAPKHQPLLSRPVKAPYGIELDESGGGA